MKKYYVKTAEGVLVSATPEQIADAKTEKFVLEVPDPPPVPGDNPLKEVADLLRQLATDVRATTDKQTEQIEAYKKAAAKGFPIPGLNAPVGDTPAGDMKDFLGHYELAYQGKRLMDKFHHPTHQIDEKTRLELAKFWCLFLRATVNQDYKARDKYWEYFGPQIKTAVGDAGNVFPLPTILETEILAFARETSVLLQYARIWDMTSEKQVFPAESSGATVAWGNTTSAGDPTISEVELDANELSSYSTVKNATLQDARSDIVSWLTESMAEAAGLELDNQGFNGTGTPFIGVLNANGAGYSVTLTGTAFQNVGFTDLSAMIAKLDGLKKQGARFWFHGQILHYVRILKDDNNRPIFYDTIGAPTSGTILGYPYTEVIKAPSNTGSNTAFMAFGSLRYVAVGRRLDTANLSVDPYGLFLTNRTRYKLYQRWAIKCALRNGLVRMLTA